MVDATLEPQSRLLHQDASKEIAVPSLLPMTLTPAAKHFLAQPEIA